MLKGRSLELENLMQIQFKAEMLDSRNGITTLRFASEPSEHVETLIALIRESGVPKRIRHEMLDAVETACINNVILESIID